MPTQMTPHSRDRGQVLDRVLRAPMRLQTYRNLCYLALMFPLGVIYYTVLTVGYPLGVPLAAAVLVGISLVFPLVALVSRLADLEHGLARVLLGIDVRSTTATSGSTSRMRSGRLAIVLRTWKTVVYLLSKLLYGAVVLGLLSWLLATAGRFVFAPVYYKRASVSAHGPIPSDRLTLDVLFGWDNLLVGLTTSFRLGSWQIETLSGALVATGCGIVLLLISVHVINALAWIWGRYAQLMLAAPPGH